MNPVKILIVDDDREMCGELAEILTEEGFTVDVAYDGTAGKRLVDDEKYGVAIVDLKLPGLNGADLIRHIKSTCSTHVIVITGKPLGSDLYDTLQPREDPSRSITQFADDLAEKPFDIRKILDSIKRATTA